MSYFLPTEQATQQLGQALSQLIRSSGVERLHLHLQGELGAGKTTLVRSMLGQLGYIGTVRSPTYSLVEHYLLEVDINSKINFYHFDFYRFNQQQEWLESGFQEYFEADAVCVVEWPECAGSDLPSADIQVQFFYAVSPDDTATETQSLALNPTSSASEIATLSRRVELRALTSIGRTCLERLAPHCLLAAAF